MSYLWVVKRLGIFSKLLSQIFVESVDRLDEWHRAKINLFYHNTYDFNWLPRLVMGW